MRRLFPPVLFFVNLIIVLSIWASVHWQSVIIGSIADRLLAIGSLSGLLAFYLILWQLLLIGRVSWIEKHWGHDVLSRIHHTIGLSAILFIIMHAMLITLSYSITANITPTEQFKVFISSYAYMIPAIIAFFAFIAIIFVSINLIRKKLKYEYWYYVHIFLYGAIILAFGHQLKLGQSLSSSLATTYWQIIFFGTIFCLIYYRFAKPLLRFKKYKFQVSNIVRENYNVLSIYISSKEAFSL